MGCFLAQTEAAFPMTGVAYAFRTIGREDACIYLLLGLLGSTLDPPKQ